MSLYSQRKQTTSSTSKSCVNLLNKEETVVLFPGFLFKEMLYNNDGVLNC